ncbi:MAG: hypothetical protein JO353_06830 [Phycisphaerae bacterium]|nr:hypothetical protein [Phycisphaerae bacterium]
MTRRTIDPDVTRRDDGAYWAAALVLAIKAGDTARKTTAQQHLQRLGYDLHIARQQPAKRKAVRNAR